MGVREKLDSELNVPAVLGFFVAVVVLIIITVVMIVTSNNEPPKQEIELRRVWEGGSSGGFSKSMLEEDENPFDLDKQ